MACGNHHTTEQYYTLPYKVGKIIRVRPKGLTIQPLKFQFLMSSWAVCWTGSLTSKKWWCLRIKCCSSSDFQCSKTRQGPIPYHPCMAYIYLHLMDFHGKCREINQSHGCYGNDSQGMNSQFSHGVFSRLQIASHRAFHIEKRLHQHCIGYRRDGEKYKMYSFGRIYLPKHYIKKLIIYHHNTINMIWSMVIYTENGTDIHLLFQNIKDSFGTVDVP